MSARAIVALDVASLGEALRLVRRLGDACDFYKVGQELFAAEGPGAVTALIEEGKDVFLDLKFHDIPNTVRGAVRASVRLGVRLLTVHASGGGEMLTASAEAAGAECEVLAVTVLTSLEGSSLGEVWGRPVTDVQTEVLRLAGLARGTGVHGLVCGGNEVQAVREAYGESLRLLVPGIRLAGHDVHDQVRVATAEAALAAGADYLVLGRAVTASPDPRAAMEQFSEIMRCA